MSSIARDRIRRCLAMIPLIRARPGIRIPDLASIFGVREDEIWEDITEVLTMCGIPPYLPHNYLVFSILGDRVSIRFAEHLSRPVHLTLQEALAIDLALRSVSGGRVPTFGDAAPRLRKTVRGLIRGKDRTALDVLDRAVGGTAPTDHVTGTIGVLKAAMARNVAVSISYYTASRDAVSERVLEPYGLIDHSGHWYVIGRDPARNREAPFRVDRINTAALVEGHEYEVPDSFTTESYRRDEMWIPGPDDVLVRVRFSKRAAPRIREGVPKKLIEELPGGEVIRTFRINADRPRWLYTHIARYGSHAEVMTPEHVRSGMAAFLDEVLGTYGVDAQDMSTNGKRGQTPDDEGLKPMTPTTRKAAASSPPRRSASARRATRKAPKRSSRKRPSE